MWTDHQCQEHIVVLVDISNKEDAVNVRTNNGIRYLSPHQLPFLILLLMVLGNGRDSFFNIRAGCEIRRWSEVGRR